MRIPDIRIRFNNIVSKNGLVKVSIYSNTGLDYVIANRYVIENTREKYSHPYVKFYLDDKQVLSCRVSQIISLDDTSIEEVII